MSSNLPETFSSADIKFVSCVINRIIRSSDAQDIAQEAMATAFLKRDQFRGESEYRTWLYRIAVNCALGHLRSARRKAAFLQAHAPDADSTYATNARDAIEDQQQAAFVRARVSEMQPIYRDILTLRYGADMSEVEVARSLGISIANVKIRGFRARALLRQIFEAEAS